MELEKFLNDSIARTNRNMQIVSQKEYWDWLVNYLETRSNHCFDDEDAAYTDNNQQAHDNGLLLSYFFDFVREEGKKQSIFDKSDYYSDSEARLVFMYKDKYYEAWTICGQGSLSGVNICEDVPETDIIILGKEMTAQDKRDAELIEYILVNKDLHMSIGKTAAQVGHVCGLVAEKESETEKYRSWKEDYDSKKVVLAAPEETMLKLEHNFYSIRDKGYTEIPPNSLTAISLGIMTRKQASKYVKHLRTL